jgi:hypothetical protein
MTDDESPFGGNGRLSVNAEYVDTKAEAIAKIRKAAGLAAERGSDG